MPSIPPPPTPQPEQAEEEEEEVTAPLRPSSADFPRLTVREKSGAARTTVRESEKVLGKTEKTKQEEYVCELTGERKVRTLVVVETLIEREVETLEEKILSLELTRPDDDEEKRDGSKDDRREEADEYDDADTTASEPPTPTTAEDKPIISVNDGGTPNKKKRRKKSKRGRN